ncbi:MAG: helix-turn-helix domain-containing protein [Hyphomicrobium sp.]|jgi:chromosomal replication initiation ATPase DnaA
MMLQQSVTHHCYGRPIVAARSGASREAIEYAVTQVFGIAGRDLRRSTRGRARVALARQVAMYIAHVGCGLSLTETGRLFERDRTTVAHACGVIEDRRDDPLFDRVLDLIEWSVPVLAERPAPHHQAAS